MPRCERQSCPRLGVTFTSSTSSNMDTPCPYFSTDSISNAWNVSASESASISGKGESKYVCSQLREIFISELVDEPQVGGVHKAYIIDTPAQQREAIEPHAERETSILFWIDPCVLQNTRMHHPRPHHLYPLTPKFFRCRFPHDTHIHLNAGLSERKKARAKTH